MGLAVIYGFTVSGSPFNIRDKKIDQEITRNIREISNAIRSYYGEKRTLPGTLNELIVEGRSYAASFKDPRTGKEFDYLPNKDNATYKLCAAFVTESTQNQDNKTIYYNRYDTDLSMHPRGYHCFEFKINNY